MSNKFHIQFSVSGMHCQSCEQIVKEELLAVAGVISAEVNSQTGKGSLIVDRPIDSSQIITAISKAGYVGTIS